MQRDTSRVQGRIRQLDQELANLYQAIADGIPGANLADPIEDRKHQKAELEKESDICDVITGGSTLSDICKT